MGHFFFSFVFTQTRCICSLVVGKVVVVVMAGSVMVVVFIVGSGMVLVAVGTAKLVFFGDGTVDNVKAGIVLVMTGCFSLHKDKCLMKSDLRNSIDWQ